MDGVVKGGKIASIYKTGLHRTEKEADKVNAFVMQSAGGNLTYEKNRLKWGDRYLLSFQFILMNGFKEVCEIQLAWK